MTDEQIDDIAVRGAIVRDADLESAAVHAAFTAALGTLIDMQCEPVSGPPTPDAPPEPTYLSKPRPRHSAGRRVLTAAAALFVLLVGAAGLASTGSGQTDTKKETPSANAPASGLNPLPPVRFPPPDPADQPPADAPLADRYGYALDVAMLTNIVHIVGETESSFRTESWRDEASGSRRVIQNNDSPPNFDSVSVPGRVCSGDNTMTPEGFGIDTETYASFNPLADGQAVEDGHEVIDGKDTIRLRYTGSADGAFTWLDATTLWPIREMGNNGYVDNYEYFPRTEENFARLTDGRCPGPDTPPVSTTTTNLPPVLEDGLPPIVNRPPDPAGAPAADAPFAERFAFATRTTYFSHIIYSVSLDPRPGETTTQAWFDQASGSERGKIGREGQPPVLDTVYVPNSTCTGVSMIPPTEPEDAEQTERDVEDLATGVLVEDGRETIDGKDTIRLRYTGDRTGDFMWLDAESLLPIRTSFRSDEVEGEFITTYEYLPRTAENFALLNDGRCT